MTKNSSKIIKFNPVKKELLTNDEIMKVLSGLVRLIQKSAEYNAEQKIKQTTNYYVKKLNETVAELNKRNRQVEELLKLNDELIKNGQDY